MHNRPNKTLGVGDLDSLLEQMTPQEIRQRHGDLLDQSALDYLSEQENKLDALDHHLTSAAKGFSDALPPAPKAQLPETFSTFNYMPWWRRPNLVPRSVSLGAVGLTLFLLTFAVISQQRAKHLQRQLDELGNPSTPDFTNQVRGDLGSETLQAQYDQWFDGLMASGTALLEIGRNNRDRAILVEALNSFQKANQLRPNQPRVMRYLALTYEKLGMKNEHEQIMRQLNETR